MSSWEIGWARVADRSRARPWAVLVSVGGHLGLLAGVGLLVTAHALPTPRPRAIAVDLVPDQPAPTPPAPVPAPQQASVPAKAPVGAAPVARPAPDDGMTAATQLFAGRILDDPQNRDIRQTLPMLAPDERLVQLCDIEGLEQLRLALGGKTPDTLEPRALEEPTISGTTLVAPGAAYRLDRQWYRVSLVCTAAPDRQGVAEFRFKLGAAIPRAQWDSHNLTDEDVGMD